MKVEQADGGDGRLGQWHDHAAHDDELPRPVDPARVQVLDLADQPGLRQSRQRERDGGLDSPLRLAISARDSGPRRWISSSANRSLIALSSRGVPAATEGWSPVTMEPVPD